MRINITVIDYEPELRFTNTGKALCTFKGESSLLGKTFQCEAWEDLAETIIDLELKPGNQVTINGSFKERTWRNQERQQITEKVFVIREV